METLESVKLAAEGLWVNKMRSFLTMLGIVIGVGAVIAVMAIGQGGKAVIIGEMERFGANSFTVSVRNTHTFMRGRSDNRLRLTMEDVKMLQKKATAVKYIYPLKMMNMEARYGKVKNSAQVIATTPDFEEARKQNLVKGRFFNAREMQAQRRVAVIDAQLARELFKKTAPLGQQFKLGGYSWTVIGVFEEEKSAFSFVKMPGLVYVPLTTYQSTTGDRYFSFIQGVVSGKDTLEEASHQALTLLNREHRTVGKFEVQTLDTIVDAVSKIVNTLTLIIGAIAGISLFVGGIGVMNIMLVSVTERTREIGIRKSLGATRRDILQQFLVEALVLCLIGGVTGILLGAGSAVIISRLMNFPPLINVWTVLIAVGFSLAVGLFFGIYPANKAARLDPIEALRYE